SGALNPPATAKHITRRTQQANFIKDSLREASGAGSPQTVSANRRVFYATPCIALQPRSVWPVQLFRSARFVMSVAALDDLPAPALPEIAFSGRSNAGKSSAINVLTGQKRLAFASKTPGRTQLLNFFELSERDEDKQVVPRGTLVDLPGYGFAQAPQAQRSQWDALVGGYVALRQTLVGI